MNKELLYYTVPSDLIFNEVKKKAIEIWNEYEDPYKSEKINLIKDIKNIEGNFMYIVSMFDFQNKRKLSNKLSLEAKNEIYKRLVSGGDGIDIMLFR